MNSFLKNTSYLLRIYSRKSGKLVVGKPGFSLEMCSLQVTHKNIPGFSDKGRLFSSNTKFHILYIDQSSVLNGAFSLLPQI